MRRSVAALALAVLLAGCGGKASPAPSGTPSTSGSASSSGLAGGSGESGGLGDGGGETSQSPAPRSTVLTTPKPTLSAPTNVAEKDGVCPYISNQDFADGEGSRVGRVTVLQTKPVGCRFYFQYDDSQIVGEIDIQTFATAVRAYNAMVDSSAGHPEVQSDATIGAGAVAFKSALQGKQAWLCVFAKGTSVVTVRTRQPYPALNALNLARTIAPRIT